MSLEVVGKLAQRPTVSGLRGREDLVEFLFGEVGDGGLDGGSDGGVTLPDLVLALGFPGLR
ncbi:hypothetical protein LQ327_28265 [Actinomycetospora endophytica]|uniref:Uncharacterized protein n=1 Tax=Actinomycetospora endophytica TaxID=2291215 RepID=A0ABS8PG89_9PSEU|nr:hypothetical protein [Actinomycetospora endophytica]MCD2197273.1 hypothetical protein [Actinomycetospora endophytica]